MRVIIAYLTVILIWSTTPLGIKWSGDSISFLFGVSSRMALGCVLAMLAVWWWKVPFGKHPHARRAWLVSGLGIYVAMLGSYWGATYIPSGWTSVVWGTAPIFTGILAKVYLGETLSWNRISGLLLSFTGLVVIFVRSTEIGPLAWVGVCLTLFGVLGQTSTAVWLKKINAGEHGLAMTAFGLLVSLPLFFTTWALFDGQLPQEIPQRAGASIIYLAVVGSLLGFSLYYFLVHSLEASRVALINLVTPVTSLLVGHSLNHEPLTWSIYLGTGLILLGLASFQWGGRLLRQ